MNIKQKKRAQKVLKRWRNPLVANRTYLEGYDSTYRKIARNQNHYDNKCKYALRRKYEKIN